MLTQLKQKRPIFTLSFILLLMLAWRLLFLYVDSRPLNTDEAQYWLWSQHLAWGYHSKPPLIAFAIALSTAIFHNTYFAIRLFASLSYFVTTIFLYLAAKKLFDKQIAFWVMLSFLLTPAVAYSSTIISTDPFMLMFWAIAFYCLVRALQQKQAYAYWLLVGLFVGFSALSKYTGLLFFLSLFLYLLFDQQKRHLLFSAKPYLALLITMLMMFPNFYWNYEHHFRAFNHVLHHNANIQGLHFYVIPFVTFLSTQLFVFSVIFFPILCILFFRRQEIKTDWRRHLLYLFSFPILLIIIIESTLSRAYANWAAPAYLTATILVVEFLLAKKKDYLLKMNLIICIVLSMVFYSGELLFVKNMITQRFHLLYFQKILGWPQIAKPIKQLQSQYPQANFVFTDRTLWAKSVFYGKLPLNKVYAWHADLDVSQSMSVAKGKDFIFITYKNKLPHEFKEVFANSKRIASIQFKADGKKINLYLFYLQYYQG